MGHPVLQLTGRVAVVLGGTSGLGRAVSLALAAAGADVVASGRRPDAVDAVAAEIEAAGRRTLRVPVDVRGREDLEQLRDRCVTTLGRVDILANCAGQIRRTPTLELSEAEWTASLDINLTGILRACQVFGTSMCEQGYGRIINIASLTSFVGLLEVTAYAAGKAGVLGLTRSLAVEWARHRVTVNAIAPGIFPTDLNRQLLEGTARGKELLMRIPMGRYGRPDEIAGAAVLLASEGASYITGQTIVIDGGFLSSGVNQ
jgi:NAD(P)-dependent dehydrogenase (short-subunit alcohol dehydrogenase family)